jgi:hypothetical protein
MRGFHMNNLPCLDHVGYESMPGEYFHLVVLPLEHLPHYPPSYSDQPQIDFGAGSQADSG